MSSCGVHLTGYLIAAGCFDLALPSFQDSSASGHRSLWVRGASRRPQRFSIPSWKAFKRGVTEVVSDRLVLITSAAHAAQFRARRHAPMPFCTLRSRGLEPFWIRARLAVQLTDGHDTYGTAGHRPRIKLYRTNGPFLRQPAWPSAVPRCFRCLWRPASRRDRRGRDARGRRRDHHRSDERVHHRPHRRARYGAAHGVFGTIYDIGDALARFLRAFSSQDLATRPCSR